jgi:hypothetical protein
MKTKVVKIMVIAAVFAFFSAGVSMAQDRMGGRQNTQKAKAYGHYKQDKNHKFEHNRHFKMYHGHKRYSKYHQCPRCRPVGLHRDHHHAAYKKYRSYTGVVWHLSVLDPNMAFSSGVKGR